MVDIGFSVVMLPRRQGVVGLVVAHFGVQWVMPYSVQSVW